MFGWFSEARHGKPVRMQLARARTIAVAHCIDGERQRVTGIVEGAMPLTSPITGRACVYWLVSIDEVGQGDWVERGVTDQGSAFILRDETGLARVIPDGARCDLPATSLTFLPTGVLGPGADALYQRLQIRLNYPGSSKVRFNERIVTAGMRLTVLGHNQHEPMQEASATDVDASGYRGELPMRPVFSSSRRKPLLIGAA